MDLIVTTGAAACLLPADAPDYPDDLLLSIYRQTRTIAMVGASSNWNRPSYFVMRYLQRKGFRVIPVNPRALDAPILGETVYPDLESVPVSVDVVDVFRRPDETPAIARSAAAIGAKVVWLQLGIRSSEAGRSRRPPGSRHRGPLHEDRVRPPRRRAGMERDQHEADLEPARTPPRMTDVEREDPPDSGAPPLPIDEAYGFETRAVHAGATPDPTGRAQHADLPDHVLRVRRRRPRGGAVQPPDLRLHLLAADEPDGRGARGAGRGTRGRPRRRRGGLRARGAVAGVLHAAGAGRRLHRSRQLYGGSLTQFRHTFKRFGWRVVRRPADPDDFRKALTPRTKAIFVESLANPGGIVVDLEPLAAIAHEAGIPLVVDNTMASPYLCRPFEWGADLVIHSMTKFLSGHGTSMGGVVVESGRFDWAASGKFPFLAGPIPPITGSTSSRRSATSGSR